MDEMIYDIEFVECRRKVLVLHVRECGYSPLWSVGCLLTVKADTKSMIICL